MELLNIVLINANPQHAHHYPDPLLLIVLTWIEQLRVALKVLLAAAVVITNRKIGNDCYYRPEWSVINLNLTA